MKLPRLFFDRGANARKLETGPSSTNTRSYYMKVIFVYPRFEKFLSTNTDLDSGLVDYFLGDFTTPPSLGIPILAALTPPDVDIELVDDNSGDAINFDEPVDLVAINCFTPQAVRAFEIADGFRARGTKVIMGGLFPSFMVDECLAHADSVALGEGEPVWGRILNDVRNGLLRTSYRGGARMDLSTMPVPKREIFYARDTYDWDEDLVQVSRGCSYNCAMCSLPAHMGSRIRLRPVEDVIREVAELRHENVYLADDTLFFPHRKLGEYARKLFESLAPLGKKYFVSSTMALNADPAFLDLAARAGVKNFYCTMNVDPISIRALQGGSNERRRLRELVASLRDRDIRFFGSCALGRDWDDESIGERILELFDYADIHTAEFFLFTPYPGSVHWDRLERQGRIIDRDWSRFNGAHVVSRPLKMSADRLSEQFTTVWNEFFRSRKRSHAAALEPATYREGIQVVGKPLERRGVQGRAAITGVGLLSPIGSDHDEILDALRRARHGLSPITLFDASHFRTSIGGQVRDFRAESLLTKREMEEYEDDYLRYGIWSARRAIADAGLAWKVGEVRRDVALVLGTCNGGLRSAEAEYAWKHGKAQRAFDEKMNLQAQYYGFGKALAGALGIGGECWVVVTACSAATNALGIARMLVSEGYYSTVLVGASDTMCVSNVAGFDGLKATSTERAAPFSLPVGLNVGEGACFWVVEDMQQALLRHARCLGTIEGHADTGDAYHPTAPDPRGEGVYRTLRNAVEDAGIGLEDLGCINAHGTGTEANDRAESRGIARLIGSRQIPVVSLKSFFGHCMGVTGLLEATCGLYAMREGFVPPTINFTEPRPGCNLDYVPNTPREKRYRCFISSNYAFGGNNAAVVISSWDERRAAPRPAEELTVVTGAGTVTSLGLGSRSLLAALRSGNTGIGDTGRLGLPHTKSSMAGLVPRFRASEVDRRLDFSGLNSISRFAVAAASLALGDAGLKVTRRNAEDVGIAMGVCNGPPETAHMDKVFESDTYGADIGSFSNITANSTAGWVSSALCLKGVNTSVAPGPHAGLQSLAYAHLALHRGRSKAVLAAAADEVYPQTYFNYDMIGYLFRGEEERDYRLRAEEKRRKVLGEGAGVLVLETAAHAEQRGAEVLAEVAGYGMSMDAGAFSEQCMEPDGLVHAVETALTRGGVSAGDVDLVAWAPQGNAQDRKMLETLETVLGKRSTTVPLVTTTFNTGYIESASILVTIGAVLAAVHDAGGLWPQRTGLSRIDTRPMPDRRRTLLALGSSDVGYNMAVVLRIPPRP